MIQVDEDAWLCRTWKRTPELSDQWRTAGPPTTTIRSAMAGIPDPGVRHLVDAEPDYFLQTEVANGVEPGLGVEA